MKALSNPGRAPASAVSNGVEVGASASVAVFVAGLVQYAFPFLDEVKGSEAGLIAAAGIVFGLITSVIRNLTSQEYVAAPTHESSDPRSIGGGDPTGPVLTPTSPPSLDGLE